MGRREGATLVEVLVAIFVMAIGLLALLTLFPLGILRIAQAMQDDQCATASRTAEAIATLKNIRREPLAAPGFVLNPLRPTPPYNAPDPQGPSYPVLVDPVGYRQALFNSQQWVGVGSGTDPNIIGRVQRVPASFANSNTEIYRWFSLLDDISFDNDPITGGIPRNVLPPPQFKIERDIRYSWAFLLQKPRTMDDSTVLCSVVVFNRRPLTLTTNLTLSEAAYLANFDTVSNTVTIDHGGVPPPIRPGDWILDATYVATTTSAGVNHGSAHGFFYRVVAVTEVSGTAMQFEVQTPLRGFPPATTTNAGSVIFMEGVAEVFELGPGRRRD